MSKTAFGRLARTLLTREVEKTVEGSRHIFVTRFSRISVNAMTNLRKNLRKSDARFLVVKNTLGRRVVESLPVKDLAPLVQGQCGVGVTNADAARVSKIFMSFSEENNGFKVCGAVLDGEMFSFDMIKRLSLLPSREELLSQVAAGLKSPITSMVGVLKQVMGNVVGVLHQIKEAKEK